MYSRNSVFHLEIITGLTSNFTPSLESVYYFLLASKVTLALNSIENLHLVYLLIIFKFKLNF
jgi:hypothetical protein